MLYFTASNLQHVFESEDPRKAETTNAGDGRKQKGTKNTERKTKQQQFYSEVLSNYNFTEMNTTIQ
jgi:hypothetical protein